jgi:3-phenylpropionate/trans-cinnamate dioxygenase ferredoxin reductase subunit
MKSYQYIIVGGGMTADAAVDGIREMDLTGDIALISKEQDPPYNRPPLSKGLWAKTPEEKIWRHTKEKQADIYLQNLVTNIEPVGKIVNMESGEQLHYENLLLATGGVKRKLPFGENHVLYYRTYRDYLSLRHLSKEKTRLAIIGSGFIGSELAAALAQNGNEVSIFDIGPGIGWNVFPLNLVNFLNQYYEEHHVKIIPNEKIIDITKSPDGITIETESGKSFSFDAVVAGVGILPNTSLAEAIGLKVENGIVVDKFARTSIKNIFSAGDVANFLAPGLNQRIRVEHADNANVMGKLAGRNMAGADEPYEYLPLFYSDLFDLGYEAVGILNPNYEVIADWQEKFAKGVLYYLKDSHVRGVLLWNVWDKVKEARELISLSKPFSKKDLVGKIT